MLLSEIIPPRTLLCVSAEQHALIKLAQEKIKNTKSEHNNKEKKTK